MERSGLESWLCHAKHGDSMTKPWTLACERSWQHLPTAAGVKFSMNCILNTTKQNASMITVYQVRNSGVIFYLWRGIFYFHSDTEHPPSHLFILSRLSILHSDICLKLENPPLLLAVPSLLLFLIFVPGTKVMKTNPLLLQGDTV